MKYLLLLILLCFASAVHAAERPLPEFSMSAAGDLEIGPDGKVLSWKMDSAKLGAKVDSLLQRNVALWRFEPILLNGKPVIARTRMSVTLEALPQGDEYVIKVSNVWFGAQPRMRGQMVGPNYPKTAMKSGWGARVLVKFKVDANGSVVAVHPYQTSLSRHASPGQEQLWRKRFERASLAAVSRWQFVPDESIGGVARGYTMIVPIHFDLYGSRKDDDARWKGFVPGPIAPAPWPGDESVAQVDTADLGDGQAAVLDSPFKLRSKVVGEAL